MKKDSVLLQLLKEEYERLAEFEEITDWIDYEEYGLQFGTSPNTRLIELLDELIKEYEPNFLNLEERAKKKKQDEIDKLLEMEVTFGKFKGQPLSEVDTDYMQWAIKNVRDEDKKELIKTMFKLLKMGHYKSNPYLDEVEDGLDWYDYF